MCGEHMLLLPASLSGLPDASIHQVMGLALPTDPERKSKVLSYVPGSKIYLHRIILGDHYTNSKL